MDSTKIMAVDRDWTAFTKEQEAMTKDVPDDVLAAIKRIKPVTLYRTHCGCEPPGHDADCRGGQTSFLGHDFADAADARLVADWLRAAHEQPPVDWLAAIIEAAQEQGTCIAQALRQRIPNIDQHAPAATDGD